MPKVEYSPGPPKSGVAAVVVELGRPVRVVEVLQMDYEARLQLALDVGKILKLLAHSPLGPVLMKDFRREQFVIVDGLLKLSDVDDVVVGDPYCTSAKDCIIQDTTKDAILTSGEILCSCAVTFQPAFLVSMHFTAVCLEPPRCDHTVFHLEKLKDLTCAQEYAVTISNRFGVLETIEDPVEL
ncbi:Extracellular tyrosine-protein kinase PKDCC [Portunus trituberculatus]|uniref:Extracellular tyrosine-protein kinase PKDCC n=1 Tax=Portunus trituberculatus TaxID=210409 RepID=A0A5B7H4X7_PORTR|nr:Extracellular tyrosine-protein kinase PKDCC [Portunus trituberculatus]